MSHPRPTRDGRFPNDGRHVACRIYGRRARQFARVWERLSDVVLFCRCCACPVHCHVRYLVQSCFQDRQLAHQLAFYLKGSLVYKGLALISDVVFLYIFRPPCVSHCFIRLNYACARIRLSLLLCRFVVACPCGLLRHSHRHGEQRDRADCCPRRGRYLERVAPPVYEALEECLRRRGTGRAPSVAVGARRHTSQVECMVVKACAS